jgi:hypothetical protein
MTSSEHTVDTAGETMVTIPEPRFARVPRWCKYGNGCLWSDCRHRHERCGHYDSWLARGKRGHNCRAIATDPESCKSPEEGGCKYDHRDPDKLVVYQKRRVCSTEKELLDSFMGLGLDFRSSFAYDTTEMHAEDKLLLIRSLLKHDVEFDDYETWVWIKV